MASLPAFPSSGARCTSAVIGVARVHLVPRIQPADRRLELAELVPDEELFAAVTAHLDERRLIGTRVELLPARYRGVTVVANVQVGSRTDIRRVEEEALGPSRCVHNYGHGGTGVGLGWGCARDVLEIVARA